MKSSWIYFSRKSSQISLMRFTVFIFSEIANVELITLFLLKKKISGCKNTKISANQRKMGMENLMESAKYDEY